MRCVTSGAEPVLVRKPNRSSNAGLDGLIIPGGESTTFLKFLERGRLPRIALAILRRHDPHLRHLCRVQFFSQKTSTPARKQASPYSTSPSSATPTAARSTAPSKRPPPPRRDFDTGPLESRLIRAPRIQSVGKDVTVLAERDGFPVLVRQGHLLAATFHPELSADRRVHRYFVDMVREANDAPLPTRRPNRVHIDRARKS